MELHGIYFGGTQPESVAELPIDCRKFSEVRETWIRRGPSCAKTEQQKARCAAALLSQDEL